MATYRGTATNGGFSQKWAYGDWSNSIYDSSSDCFRSTLTARTEYQHQCSASQGEYGPEITMPYTLTNSNVNGSSISFNSKTEAHAIIYQQNTGAHWAATTYAYVPRGSRSKSVALTSENPNTAHEFWNYSASGTFDTPTFSWEEPSATVSVVNNTVGNVTIDVSEYAYAGGTVPADFSSEDLYCDTKTSPTTKRIKGESFPVESYTTYYWKYILRDNHGTSKTYTGNFKTLGNNPAVDEVEVTDITDSKATVSFTASYDTNDSFKSYLFEYGLSTNYGTDVTGSEKEDINLTGLKNNTTYHYKLTVEGAQGGQGEYEGTFKTLPPLDLEEKIEIEEIYVSAVEIMASLNNPTLAKELYCKIYALEETEPVEERVISSDLEYNNPIRFDGLTPSTVYRITLNYKTMWDTITTTATSSIRTLDATHLEGTISKDTAKLFTELDIHREDEKTLITRDQVVVVNGKIRYIDIIQAGNSENNSSHIVELQAYDRSGQNVALGKEAELLKGTHSGTGSLDVITNGETASSGYYGIYGADEDLETIVRVDLGKDYTEITHVILWRFYSDNREYYKTKVYGRDSETQLTWKFQSYKINGVYKETAAGHSMFVKEAFELTKTEEKYTNTSGRVYDLTVDGASIQEEEPSPEAPSEIHSVGESGELLLENVGQNLLKPYPPANDSDYWYGFSTHFNSITDDGWVRIDAKNTGTNYLYANSFIILDSVTSKSIKPNTQYKIVVEIRNTRLADGKNVGKLVITEGRHPSEVFSSYFAIDGKDIQNNAYNRTVSTREDFSEVYLLMRAFVEIPPGSDFSYEYRMALYEVENSPNVFEPYRNTTTQIPLNIPLRSLPNGVKDEFYYKDGNVVVTRNVGVLNVNKLTAWYFSGQSIKCQFDPLLYNMSNIYHFSSISNLYCNYYRSSSGSLIFDGELNSIAIDTTVYTPAIYVPKGNYENATDFRDWLQQKEDAGNPVVIQYQLETPTTETYTVDEFSLIPRDGSLSLIDSVKSNLELTYYRDK